MKSITLHAHDGQALAGYRFEPSDSTRMKGSIVIAPAMAVPQSYYVAFARYLALSGYRVWTFDYRGIGESLTGSKRHAKADLSDWFLRDCDAVVNTAADAEPRLPLLLIGHSFGGQSAPLLPSRERIRGLINIAVGSGALRHNPPSLRRRARLLWYLLVPLLCPIFGFFPGARIGVLGDIPAAAMFQWRRWCLTPDYILTGEPGARAAYRSAEFPVLGLTFSDDELLLEAGSSMLHAAYARAVDYRLIAPADVGMARIGHTGFFRPQSEATLWPIVIAWLDGQRG